MANVSAVPVLVEWERFTTENPQGNLREFATWLLNHHEPLRRSPVSPDAEPLMKSGMRLSEAFREGEDFLAWFFMGRMNRYVRFYTKSIMAEHGMSSPDEFLFLSLINEMDRPTKKEVCLANATELTTGMDILRRLLKHGLIDEQPDERDGRSKRLDLTSKGRETVQGVQQELMQLDRHVLGELDEAERRHFLQTLQYLNNYHFPFFKI